MKSSIHPITPNITSILKQKEHEYSVNQKLLKAVEIGHCEDVRKLIAKGATLHKLQGIQLHRYSPAEHDTLLHTAVKLGHEEVVSYLLTCACDINARTRRLRAPLHYATYLDVPNHILELLLTNNATVDIKDDDGASPFMWACYLNNLVAAQRLLAAGADIISADLFKLSPLEWAAHQGNLAIVKWLLSAAEYTPKQLRSARVQAFDNGHKSMIKLLARILHEEVEARAWTPYNLAA